MGVQDVPAMVKAITKVSGACQKISYVGHDIGNTQVFYGLAQVEEIQSYFSQVVALAPCFVPNVDSIFPFYEMNQTNFRAIWLLMGGLHFESAFGPDWSTQIDQFCLQVPEKTAQCALAKLANVGPAAGGSNFGIQEMAL